MVLDKFQTGFDYNKCINPEMSSKEQSISPVPLIMKFHGESDSDSPWVDLYRKIISFDKKMRSKWRSTGPYIPSFKVVQ